MSSGVRLVIGTLVGAAVVLVASIAVPDRLPLGIVLQGAALGAGTGLLGVGLVLTYRSNRIVNFAYGAMGGLAASVAIALHLGPAGLPWPACVAVAMTLGVVIGFFVELIVVRRFANASRLVLTMGTIGLAQVLGGMALLVPATIGGPPLIGSFETPLNAISVAVDPVIITGNDLALVAVVPLILGALGWFLLRTEAGIAVRGIAENTDRARLLGIPVARLSTLVWCIAGLAAATTVVLKAPGEGLVLEAAAGPQLLLPALAAAVLAGMEDLRKAFVAGLGLGVLDQVIRWNVDKQSVTTVVFLVVILAALLLARHRRGRADDTDSVWTTTTGARMPEAMARLRQVRVSRQALFGVLMVAVVAIPFLWSPSQVNRASVTVVLGIVALSVVLLTGWSGSVSLGQFAIAGTGGLVAANLIGRTEVDAFVALLAAGVVGAGVAILVGLPALRVSGMFLAVTTLAFAVAIDSFFLNPVNFREAIPGSFNRPVLWGRIDLQSETAMYYLCLAILGLTTAALLGIRRARTGRVMLATRDNAPSAAASGVSPVRTRVGAFIISGAVAGVGGALYAFVLAGLGHHTYETSTSLLVFSMALIGGIEVVGGALIGVVVVQVVSYLLPEFRLIVTGAGALGVLMAVPRGVIQLLRSAEIRVHTHLARWRGLDVAALLAEPGTDEEVRAERAAPPVAPDGAGSGPVGAPGGPAPILSCRSVNASYGALQVLFGVDLDVAPGEMVALLGTNGAGKSTVLRCVTGLLGLDGGRVTLDGEDLAGAGAERIARQGIALMPGGRGLFPSLTVRENLRLAAWLRRKDPGAVDAVREESIALLPRLGERLDLRAGELSGGEQQMLSLAMALAMRPKVLCIDELSLGLAPTVVADLVEHVRAVHASGTTVVIVEQSVNVALLLAERAVFLEKGAVVYEGPTAELLERPDVLRSVFVGKALERPTTDASSGDGAVRPDRGLRLECRELTKRYGGVTAVDAVELCVEPGSIVGIIGHNGAGKTTLFDLISGFTPLDAGRIRLGGRDITGEPPHRRAIAGLGRSFQQARLYPSLTVGETVTVALDQHLANRDPVAAACWLPASRDSEAAAAERVAEIIDSLGLTRYRDHLTSELSTGTRRIVELACILAQDPAVVLLDEPSAGVAQRETEALGTLLAQVRDRTGCSMLVVEHDMAMLTSLCDELVAMELGRVITRGVPTAVLEHERVVASYLGTDDAVIHRSGQGPAASGGPEVVGASLG